MAKVMIEERSVAWVATYEDSLGKYVSSSPDRDRALLILGTMLGHSGIVKNWQDTDELEIVRA